MEGVGGDGPHIWCHLPSGLCHIIPTTSTFSRGIWGFGVRNVCSLSVQMLQFQRYGWSRRGLWARGCFECHLHEGLRKTNQNLGNQTKGDPDVGWLEIWDGRDAKSSALQGEGSPSRHAGHGLPLDPLMEHWDGAGTIGMLFPSPWWDWPSWDKSASDLHNWQKEPVY